MDDFANAFDPVIAGWEEQDEGNVQDDVGGNASDCSCDDDDGSLAAQLGGNVEECGGDGETGMMKVMMGLAMGPVALIEVCKISCAILWHQVVLTVML